MDSSRKVEPAPSSSDLSRSRCLPLGTTPNSRHSLLLLLPTVLP